MTTHYHVTAMVRITKKVSMEISFSVDHKGPLSFEQAAKLIEQREGYASGALTITGVYSHN